MKYVVTYTKLRDTAYDDNVFETAVAVVGHPFGTKKEAMAYIDTITLECFGLKARPLDGMYSVHYNNQWHHFDILKFIDINEVKALADSQPV